MNSSLHIGFLTLETTLNQNIIAIFAIENNHFNCVRKITESI